MDKKALIFDSGPLINFSMNGMLSILEKLKEKSKVRFFITHDVKKEVIDRPLEILQFKLGALRIKNLVDKGILEFPESVGLSKEFLERKTNIITNLANNFIIVDGQRVNIVSVAEMSCFSLSEELKKKGYKTMIAIDERTARMLCEKPENLVKLMSERLKKKVIISGDPSYFKGYNFIRSSELIYVAFKKGLTDLKDQKALEAFILATKFKGSSISWDEINELKKL